MSSPPISANLEALGLPQFLGRCLLVGAGLFAMSAGAQAQHVLPREGAQLNRLHVRFRWPAFPTESYWLQIVEDDGSLDPFRGGFPVTNHAVSGGESRTTVISGLSWARDWAWRVVGELALHSPSSKEAPVHRFSTIPVSSEIPPMGITIPAGAPPPEPGITMYPMFRNQSYNGFLLGVDEAGELVLQFEIPGSRIQDVRMLDCGRILLCTQRPDPICDICRRAFVMTLDGGIIWSSPDTPCLSMPPPPFTREGVHHEVFPMPPGAPQGENFIMVEYDNRIIPYGGNPNLAWQGDRAVEYDRHTLDIVWQWSVFDDISLDDHLPPDHPQWPGPGGDWTHGNAVVYVAAENSVYVSLRRQSRIVRIDYATGQVIYHMGEDSFPSGDVPPDFGDNLFSAQHAPQILPNGNMVLYDNGNFREPLANTRVSRAIELVIDHTLDPPRALVVWGSPLVLEDLVTPAYAMAAGDSDRLPGGHTISNDAQHANILESDENGDLVWFLNAGPDWPSDGAGTPGAQIYRVEKRSSIVLDTPGDADGDWDIDLADLADLQNSFTGANGGPVAFPAALHDHDADGDVDAADAARTAYLLSGPAR